MGSRGRAEAATPRPDKGRALPGRLAPSEVYYTAYSISSDREGHEHHHGHEADGQHDRD
jgi:hypothetical protein